MTNFNSFKCPKINFRYFKTQITKKKFKIFDQNQFFSRLASSAQPDNKISKS